MATVSMSELLTIPGLGASSLELLEAAGFRDLKDLTQIDEESLTAELSRANRILKITDQAPLRDEVAGWINHAREVEGSAEVDPAPPIVPVDYEKIPKVEIMLNTSPLAIPLPAQVLKDGGLSVPEIPPGILLNRYAGDLDVRVEKRIPQARIQNQAHHVSSVRIAENIPQSKLDIDVSRLKSVDDIGAYRQRVHAARPSVVDDRVALIRAPKEATNKGVDPGSRRYIRGVLHNQPFTIYFGAVLTVILMLLMPVSVAAALLLLMSREVPDDYHWVPPWLLAFPMALPVFAFAWVIWGFSARCRICAQKLFMHRGHHKNAKAHHLPGMGYVLPLCSHIILFRWFRCPHCGTPVRLKK